MTEVIERKTRTAETKHDADYVFYELTRSICPECRRVIDAHILLRNNKVHIANGVRNTAGSRGWVRSSAARRNLPQRPALPALPRPTKHSFLPYSETDGRLSGQG